LNKTQCLIFAMILLMFSSVSADILSINYPAPNDIISEGSRIQVNVTSDGFSAGCYFNYDDVYNQSISCDGTSIVNMPNADETYRIKVGDNAGNYITQQVTIQKPSGIMVMFVYTITMIILCLMIFGTVALLIKLATYDMKVLDLCISLCLYVVYLIIYQLNLEYIGVPFIMNYLNLFLTTSLWIFVVFAPINYVVCVIIRSFKKKKLMDVKEL